MEGVYHRQVLQRAIGGRVSPRALAAITAANLGQDSLRGLLQLEYHFDNSLFAESLAFVEANRMAAAQAFHAAPAWAAFGRLSHAVQDFYSHSNYVALWLEQQPANDPPPANAIDGMDAAILASPRLRSGRVYMPLEALWLFKRLQPLVKRLLPRDSHAWMNLDSPETGSLFPYSIEAAIQRTLAEFERTLGAIGEEGGQTAMSVFCDLP